MIKTQVQDSSRGVPGARIPVELDLLITGQGWREVGAAVTDAQGRIDEFGETEAAGIYRLNFDVANWMPDAFFPSISVVFEVSNPYEAHEVALVLSSFGYTVYRHMS